jgi:hypothetical protein
MKRVVAMLCVAALLLTLVPGPSSGAEPAKKSPPKIAATTKEKRGGIPAFFVGCCFGIREGTEWNEGKELHWREWIPIPFMLCSVIPYVGSVIAEASGVFHIWDGIECAQGMTSHQFAEKYGTNWY